MPNYPQALIDAQIETLEKEWLHLVKEGPGANALFLNLSHKMQQFTQDMQTLQVQKDRLTKEISDIEKSIKDFQKEIDEIEQTPAVRIVRKIDQEKDARKEKCYKLENFLHFRISKFENPPEDSEPQVLSDEEITLLESMETKVFDAQKVMLLSWKEVRIQMEKDSHNLQEEIKVAFVGENKPHRLRAQSSLSDLKTLKKDANKEHTLLSMKQVELIGCNKQLELACSEKRKILRAMGPCITSLGAVGSRAQSLYQQLLILSEGEKSAAAQVLMQQLALENLQAKRATLKTALPKFIQFLKDKTDTLTAYIKKRTPGWFRKLLQRLFRLVDRNEKIKLAVSVQETIKKEVQDLNAEYSNLDANHTTTNPVELSSQSVSKLSDVQGILNKDIAENKIITKKAFFQRFTTEGTLHAELQKLHSANEEMMRDYPKEVKAYKELLVQYNAYNTERPITTASQLELHIPKHTI